MSPDLQIERKPLSELIPAPYNPRAISPEALAGLRGSVERFGLVEPVVWNRRTGRVVGGHQRLKVLQQMGETETQVVVVDLPRWRRRRSTSR
jgi:ParB-like chromosome segregation protein Spo0J